MRMLVRTKGRCGGCWWMLIPWLQLVLLYTGVIKSIKSKLSCDWFVDKVIFDGSSIDAAALMTRSPPLLPLITLPILLVSDCELFLFYFLSQFIVRWGEPYDRRYKCSTNLKRDPVPLKKPCASGLGGCLYSCGQSKPTNLFAAELKYLGQNWLQIWIRNSWKQQKKDLRWVSHAFLGAPNFWAEKIKKYCCGQSWRRQNSKEQKAKLSIENS
jgi:hypothetical protein